MGISVEFSAGLTTTKPTAIKVSHQRNYTQVFNRQFDGMAPANAPQPTPEMPKLSPKMFIAPLLLFGGSRLGIDYKNNVHAFAIRCAFVSTVVFTMAVLGWIYLAIQRRNFGADSETKVTVVSKSPTGEETSEKLTFREHDTKMLMKVVQQSMTTIGMVALMSRFIKSPQMMLLQAVMLPMGTIDQPIWLMYIRGLTDKDSSKLKRPFKEDKPPNPFEALLKPTDAVKKPDAAKRVEAAKRK